MKTTILATFAIALTIVVMTGCSKNEELQPTQSRFGDQFGGAPYLGDVTGKLFIDGALQYTW